MPSTLSAPLYRLLAMLGTGPDGRPDAQLTGLQQCLVEVATALGRTGDQLATAWSGAGADAAAARLHEAVAVTRTLAERLDALGAGLGAAAEAVARVRAELERLIADFESRAGALEAEADNPGAAAELLEEAQRAQDTGRQLVDDLRTELGGHAPALPPPAAVGGSPAGSGAGFAPSLPAGMGTSGMGTSGMGGSPIEAILAAHRELPTPDAAEFGAGETVHLPDGSSVLAPNAVAAGAVRHALTQLGVPYQWGGTTAGVGLDCSGLTQWAYREAGLTIPRLAQEQDIGSAVDAGGLRPGDLAVWDGHVAMFIGNNTMIEAGDPVQLSPVRTTNAGQGFQGFWRPTA